MSMDLSVWSPIPFDLPAQLPRAQSWVRYPHEWDFEGEGWLVIVHPADDAEPDDSVLARLPNAAYVAYVSLEPIGAGKAGYDFLEEVVRSLARVTSGVWLDVDGRPFAHDEGQFS